MSRVISINETYDFGHDLFRSRYFPRFFQVILPRILQGSSQTELSGQAMDNVRIKKRQWRPRRADDQQPRGRNQIRLTRLEDTLKVVQSADSCQRKVITNHNLWSAPKPTSTNDRFHWSKPKRQEAIESKQNSVVQLQLPDKTQTKAGISQLAGFLKKRSFSDGANTCTTVHTSDVIKKSRHTCDDNKPVYNNSKTDSCSPLKEHSSVQDSVLCDIKHRAVLGPKTKPSCSIADKSSVAAFELDDDFDYSLDLMGEYSLKVSDVAKKPTPFWFESVPDKQSATPESDALSKTDLRPSPNMSLDTTSCWHFTSEVDLDFELDIPQDDAEFDIIMNCRRGYTYINYSKHRGTKRRIAYDDEEEVPIPRKRSRTC